MPGVVPTAATARCLRCDTPQPQVTALSVTYHICNLLPYLRHPKPEQLRLDPLACCKGRPSASAPKTKFGLPCLLQEEGISIGPNTTHPSKL